MKMNPSFAVRKRHWTAFCAPRWMFWSWAITSSDVASNTAEWPQGIVNQARHGPALAG